MYTTLVQESLEQDYQDMTLEEHEVYCASLKNAQYRNAEIFELPCFAEMRAEELAQIEYAQSQPITEEGVFTCERCGSQRVFAFSKQVRSADEGMSVFAKCSECKHRWTHRG